MSVPPQCGIINVLTVEGRKANMRDLLIRCEDCGCVFPVTYCDELSTLAERIHHVHCHVAPIGCQSNERPWLACCDVDGSWKVHGTVGVKS